MSLSIFTKRLPDKKSFRELHALAESRLPPFLDQTNVQDKNEVR